MNALQNAIDMQRTLLALLHRHGIKPSSGEICDSLRLVQVEREASRLVQFLRANTGDNDDWPISIVTDNEDVADELSQRLTILEQAIKA